MRLPDARQIAILLAFALAGWMMCGAVMGIGMATTSQNNALIIHAVAAPVIFTALSVLYFRYFGFTTPLQTASLFVAVVMFMDGFLVAMLVIKSFDMFRSILGTWIPFGLIWATTYLTGVFLKSRMTIASDKKEVPD